MSTQKKYVYLYHFEFGSKCYIKGEVDNTTSRGKECRLFASPHTPCFVMKLNINKKNFPPLLEEGCIFWPHLTALLVLLVVAL